MSSSNDDLLSLIYGVSFLMNLYSVKFVMILMILKHVKRYEIKYSHIWVVLMANLTLDH